MAWKPKERPLTAEEAVARAKQSLAPFWSGSTPLFAAFPPTQITEHGEQTARRARLFPLEPDFGQRTWALVFLDPFRFQARTALHFLDHLHRAYSAHGVRAIAVLHSPLSVLEPKTLAIPRLNLPFPSVIDHDGQIRSALGIAPNPFGFSILKNSVPILGGVSPHEAYEMEQTLQNSLRAEDPGLPLTPVRKPEVYGNWSDHSLPLNERCLTHPLANALKLMLAGNWIRHPDRLIPADSSAELRIRGRILDFAVIAGQQKPSFRGAHIQAEFRKIAFYDDFIPAAAHREESGAVTLAAKHYDHLPLLEGMNAELLPSDPLEMTFRFPTLDTDPIELHSLNWTGPLD